MLETGIGAKGYQAQELFRGLPNTLASDVYAFGSFSLAILSGDAPFYELNLQQTLLAVNEGTMPSRKSYPLLTEDNPVWSLLERCWQANPTERPAMGYVLQGLQELQIANYLQRDLLPLFLAWQLTPAFEAPTDVAPPQAEVERGSWKRDTTVGKFIAVFIKKLHFPSSSTTSRDPEWEAWRKRNLETLRNRIRAANVLDPSFVLKPYGYRLEDKPCLVVPRVDGGNILQFVIARGPALAESKKLALLYDAARAIAHLHSQSPPIVHGRIHPTEILINKQERAILFDFGISHAIATLEICPPQATSGTEMLLLDGGYYAPELSDSIELTPAADVYAFAGVILVVMSGKHPHSGHRSPTLAWRKGKPNPQDHPALRSDHSLWNLMDEMWAESPADRPEMLSVTQKLENILSAQGHSVISHIEPVEHDDCIGADEQLYSYEKNPHLKQVVDEAKRILDLSSGTKFLLSKLLQDLEGKLAPELGGELVDLAASVAQGMFGYVSKQQWRTTGPNGTILETCVAVKTLRIGSLSSMEKEARLKIEFVVDLLLKRIKAAQVGTGLTYLHTKNPPIGHGDIKPRNVLITEDLTVKIGDFGLSRAIQELPTGYTTGTNVGSSGYRAPELWIDGVRPSLEGDVYAYGCLVLKVTQLLTPDPFDGVNKMDIMAAVHQRGEVSPPDVHGVQLEDPLYQHMRWCCQTHPADRPTIEEAVEKLKKDIDNLKSSGFPSR
ncbi:hypothetical protein FRC04_004838 [Tulasnella sp. 424]|nr:hypothetical protein FRC04_004838 [Tulasnella sp. 424]